MSSKYGESHIKLVSILLVLMLIATTLQAQEAPIRLTAMLHPSALTIGDPFLYTLRLEIPKGTVVQPPALTGLPEHLKLRTSPPTLLTAREAWTEVSYGLTVFSAGAHTLPTLGFTLANTDRKIAVATAPPFTLTVASVLPAEATASHLKDIKEPLTTGWPIWVYVLLTILGAGLAIWLYAKRQTLPESTEEPVEPVDPRSPAQWALDELQLLEASGLLSAENYQPFTLQLSDILRQYLERQFEIPILDRTTSEITASLRGSSITKRFHSDIRTFLEGCDLVKFAKHVPSFDDLFNQLRLARAIVEGTRPAEPEPIPVVEGEV